MIVYNLQCKNSHAFEGWFRDSAAYDAQAASGKLVCPVCETHKVEKAPMAPAVAGTKAVSAPDEMRKMRQFVTGLRKHIEQNAENVGRRFPDEARKIHYGEAEERHIYGEATVKEAKELVDEGVDVAPMPPDLDEAAN
ncbi:MAG TPA: DUF1178 family protein [Rhizomicrobium sp.]|nr:DUF1178 family protein [Rhizomicrobium sp.]